MRTIFSTADVPQAAAFDYWMDVACANFADHEAEPLDRRNFFAQLQTGTLNDLGVTRWWIAPENTRRGSIDLSDLQLVVPLSSMRLAFSERRLQVGIGALVLFDFHESFGMQALQPIEGIGVQIPRNALAQRIRITRDVVNRPVVVPGSADVALLEAFVCDLVRVGPSNLSPTAATLARQQLLDLTAVVFSSAADVTPRLGAATRFASLKLRAAIERDPNGTRESVAAAAGISVRHANRLLALEGTSIQRLLMERRLSKCREAIESHRHRRISDIAFAYGFRDLSHFGRAFKSRFGLNPSDYRTALDSAGQQSPIRSSDEG